MSSGFTKVCDGCRVRKPLKEFWLAPMSGKATLTPPTRKCKACTPDPWAPREPEMGKERVASTAGWVREYEEAERRYWP